MKEHHLCFANMIVVFTQKVYSEMKLVFSLLLIVTVDFIDHMNISLCKTSIMTMALYKLQIKVLIHLVTM